ncbi:chorismate mutase [Rhodoblastus acidophilus]|uniref:hypothetical protein n=1 Tax=Rhodoblastus acidophilus TaxID=1074 RepID=UPI0022251A7B|nr:hypothetical protein [Rhodoblastus acidophilus]MCW2315307.1 chorismate mutase [Rhodoblastus acidophilus]
MKIKVLTSIASADFSVHVGQIVEAAYIGGDTVAEAWIKNGDAIEAPATEDAAEAIAAMKEELARVTAERDGYASQVADAKTAQAKAEAERDGYKSKVEQLAKAAKAPAPPKG